jgi:hypothetical protein
MASTTMKRLAAMQHWPVLFNYTFNIGIKPQPRAQSLTVATSSTKNVVKAWGLTVSG